jgi:hypothetical protein
VRLAGGPSIGFGIIVSHTPPPQRVDQEANLLFRELSHQYVLAARSWIHFHRLSPDCYRLPFDAVLQKYMVWKERLQKGEWVSLAEFWEELLEEHGFESDRQWLARQKKHLSTVKGLLVSKYAPAIQPSNGKKSWRGRPLKEVMQEPEFSEIDPPPDRCEATEIEEYRAARPERYGKIEPRRKSRAPSETAAILAIRGIAGKSP